MEAQHVNTAAAGSPFRRSWGRVPNEAAALRFDSGDALALQDLLHHTIVVGATGSGKTSNACVPLIDSLIGANADNPEMRFPGLIVDIKGNLRRQVHAIARKHGRENDIIEIGGADTATPINLLAGMSPAEAFTFVKSLIEQRSGGTANDQNSIFLERGLADARLALDLLDILSRTVDPVVDRRRFMMNLATLAAMFNEPQLLSQVFNIYKARLHDPGDRRQGNLVAEAHCSKFSLLNWQEYQLDRNGRNSRIPQGDRNEYREQVAWSSSYVTTALQDVAGVPNILENLAAPGADGLEFGRWMREGRIVLLHFPVQMSRIGGMFARAIANKFYETVYATGLDMPEERMSFVVMDEFASFCDLSDGQHSDRLFISKAREFRCAFVAATQGISDLSLRCGGNMAYVHSFLNNANNQVFFYTEDRVTREYVREVAPLVDLLDMKQSQAFVKRFDTLGRRHESGIQSLWNAYGSTKELCGSGGVMRPAAPRETIGSDYLLRLVHALEMSVTKEDETTMLDSAMWNGVEPPKPRR